MLSKVVSSTIFKVFGMTRPGIEPRSPGPLANDLLFKAYVKFLQFLHSHYLKIEIYEFVLDFVILFCLLLIRTLNDFCKTIYLSFIFFLEIVNGNRYVRISSLFILPQCFNFSVYEKRGKIFSSEHSHRKKVIVNIPTKLVYLNNVNFTDEAISPSI